MALYVIPVPQPAAAADWSYAVPGQYIEHITAISATLDNGGVGATVYLTITDGTHEVLRVPTGFAPPPPAGPYLYSWQPNLNSSTQTPDGTLTTVAIPDLILPAGYTIGTVTDPFGPGSPDLPTDYSGNFNNGTYITSSGSPTFVAGAFTGDAALDTGDVGPPNQTAGVVAQGIAAPLTASFTFVIWLKVPTSPFIPEIVSTDDGATNVQTAVQMGVNGALNFHGPFTGFQASTANHAVPFDNAWHMYTFVYDAGTTHGTIYKDGVAVALIFDGTGPAVTAPVSNLTIAADYGGNTGFLGAADEFAYFDVALTAGQVAALYATAPDLAAWTAAVLALSPTTAYHLDGVTSPGGQWSNVNIWWNSDIMDADPQLNPIDYPPGAYLVIVPQGV